MFESSWWAWRALGWGAEVWKVGWLEAWSCHPWADLKSAAGPGWLSWEPQWVPQSNGTKGHPGAGAFSSQSSGWTTWGCALSPCSDIVLCPQPPSGDRRRVWAEQGHSAVGTSLVCWPLLVTEPSVPVSCLFNEGHNPVMA